MIGIALRKRLKSAVVEKIAQDRIFDDFCESLLPSNLAKWTAEVVAWENDLTLLNPYQLPLQGGYISVIYSTHYLYNPIGATEAEIKAQLLEDDSDQLDDKLPQGTQATPTTIMIAMCEMENRQ